MSQVLNGGNERVDGFGASGPAGAEAYRRAAIVDASPRREHKLLAENFYLLRGEDGELLIGAAFYEKLYAASGKGIANTQCLLHSV